jgi:hypothetical protein
LEPVEPDELVDGVVDVPADPVVVEPVVPEVVELEPVAELLEDEVPGIETAVTDE